jgi:hypothetical protein
MQRSMTPSDRVANRRKLLLFFFGCMELTKRKDGRTARLAGHSVRGFRAVPSPGAGCEAARGITGRRGSRSPRVLQFGDGVDLFDRRLDVVLDVAIADGVAVEQNVARPPVAVARLADRADVAEGLRPSRR